MAYATIHHFIIALNSHHDRKQILFVAMCFLTVLFAFFQASVFQATTIDEYVWMLKWNIASILLFFLIFPWFISLYTGLQPRSFLVALSVLFILLFAVNVIQPYSMQYDKIDTLEKLHLLNVGVISRVVGHNSHWFKIASIGALVAFSYAIYAAGKTYFCSRRRLDLWMLCAIALFFVGGIDGILVRMGIINFIELGAFSLIAMVIVMSVTVTIETQQRLRNSEHKFRSIFDNSPAAMVSIDPNSGRILQANHIALRLTGYSYDEILTKTASDLTCPEDQQATRDSYRHLANGQEERISHEKRYLKKDGSTFYGYTSISPIKDEEGKVTHFIGSTVDITERKQIELALQESEVRYRTIIEQAPIAISIGRNGIVADVNSACLKMFAYADKADMCGQSILNFYAPLSRAEAEYRIAQRMQGNPVETPFEALGLRKDGSQFPMTVSAKAVLMEDGLLTFGFLIDISERTKSEVELRIAATAFESQESMIITDADSVILRVNQAFADSTGYTTDEIVGQTPRLLQSGRHTSEFYREMWDTLSKTGNWQGEVWDKRKNGEIYPKWLSISAVKGKDGVVTHYVGMHTDITERKAAEEKIKHIAFHDSLTELPNRLLLIDRLKQALASCIRNGRAGAILYLDLDNFKNLNDTLGHDIGDLLLQQVTQRLKTGIREGDTVARLGGDEFVVLLLDLNGNLYEAAAMAGDIGEKILAALSHPYQFDKHTHRCTASIGITLFNHKQQNIEELMKQADIAMYQAKKAGRNVLRFFDQQMQENISARVTMESELHNAIELQQLHLFYQIQVDSINRPLGAEALIRWIHPVRGLISPAQFIPLAEESGLILAIGQWVLEKACAQIKTWQQDERTRNLELAVNVSARQFHQADFSLQIEEVVQRHGINPKLLKLELTEGMLLENIDLIVTTMNKLSDIGVQLSLDDFGTGFSSLQYLKQLPLDQLKIDQSFIREIAINTDEKAIVSTIVAMAHILELNVIAEGVETENQRQTLVNIGCTQFQGYLFGQAVPIEQFEIMIQQYY